MTTLVRRYLHTAIGFLIVGLLLGGVTLARRELADVYPSPYLVSAHTHAILVGFVMLMILGVALWMFPRPPKDDVRYSPRVAQVTYWLVTVGTAGRVAAELLRTINSEPWLRWTTVWCGFAQIAGLVLFFYNMRSRIRGVGSQSREENGERF